MSFAETSERLIRFMNHAAIPIRSNSSSMNTPQIRQQNTASITDERPVNLGAARQAAGLTSDPVGFVPPTRNFRRFAGHTVFITGGNSGLGRHAAFTFMFEGAHVIVGDLEGTRDQHKAMIERAKELKLEGTLDFVPCDVRIESDIENAIKFIVDKFGRLDHAFNNAGFPVFKYVHETKAEELDNIIGVNFRGVFLCMKHEIIQMLKQKPRPEEYTNVKGVIRGTIVNTASVGGLLGSPLIPSYSATKHAIVGLTKSCARYSSLGIRINVICPGVTQSTGVVSHFDIIFDQTKIPYERYGVPDNISSVVLFLCSAESEYMIGQPVVVDGAGTALINFYRMDPLPFDNRSEEEKAKQRNRPEIDVNKMFEMHNRRYIEQPKL